MPELKTLFNDQQLPILNPVQTKTDLDNLPITGLLVGSKCYVKDDNADYIWTGTEWDLPPTEWVQIPPYSANWTSSAYAGFTYSKKLVVFRGTMHSVVDNNNDPVGTFPSGFQPAHGFSKPVVINRANQPVLTTGEKVTWSGGLSTLVHSVPGISSGQRVHATLEDMGTETNLLVSAKPGTNQITFTLQNANTSNDAVISYDVVKTQPVITADCGTSGNLFGITPTMNNGDFVYMDGIVYDML